METSNTMTAAAMNEKTAIDSYCRETSQLSLVDKKSLAARMLLMAVLHHKPALPNYSRGKRK